MPRSERGPVRQAGFASILLVIIAVVGIVIGVILVQRQQQLKSQASISGPLTPTTSMSLQVTPASVAPNETFKLSIAVHSDIDSANLFAAKLSFPYAFMQVVDIDYTNSFISSWVEQFYDNNTGEVSLVGGVPDPGYKTTINDPASVMAVITFKSTGTIGKGTVSFVPDTGIYRNADGADILAERSVGEINIAYATASASPYASSTPSPSPSQEPTGGLAVSQSAVQVSVLPLQAVKIFDMTNTSNHNINYVFTNLKSDGAIQSAIAASPGSGVIGAGITVPVSIVAGANSITIAPGTYSSNLILTDQSDYSKNITIPLQVTVLPVPSTSPSPVICAQVITPAVNLSLKTCTDFATPCEVPASGWLALKGAADCASAGDFNSDGKVNIADASRLYAFFNKSGKFIADLNKDGIVNTIDFSLMLNLFRIKNIIR